MYDAAVPESEKRLHVLYGHEEGLTRVVFDRLTVSTKLATRTLLDVVDFAVQTRDTKQQLLFGFRWLHDACLLRLCKYRPVSDCYNLITLNPRRLPAAYRKAKWSVWDDYVYPEISTAPLQSSTGLTAARGLKSADFLPQQVDKTNTIQNWVALVPEQQHCLQRGV
jgi:hypothetical protein